MTITTKPVRIYGIEQWVSVVRLGERVLYVTKRWSEQGAKSDAMRWAQVN